MALRHGEQELSEGQKNRERERSKKQEKHEKTLSDLQDNDDRSQNGVQDGEKASSDNRAIMAARSSVDVVMLGAYESSRNRAERRQAASHLAMAEDLDGGILADHVVALLVRRR